jgi:hypothetical protein
MFQEAEVMVAKIFIRLLLAGSLVAGLSAVVYAAEKGELKTYTGTIIDNTCATANKDKLGDFVKTHTKDCAMMPGCASSGYSLYTEDGKLIAFTGKSNLKVKSYLKDSNTKLTVEVRGTTKNDKLEARSIKTKG